jgi:hypothetical protein
MVSPDEPPSIALTDSFDHAGSLFPPPQLDSLKLRAAADVGRLRCSNSTRFNVKYCRRNACYNSGFPCYAVTARVGFTAWQRLIMSSPAFTDAETPTVRSASQPPLKVTPDSRPPTLLSGSSVMRPGTVGIMTIDKVVHSAKAGHADRSGRTVPPRLHRF